MTVEQAVSLAALIGFIIAMRLIEIHLEENHGP